MECNLSATYCGHDVLDWFAAVGPTLATLVTAGVAYSAYRGSERIQRLLVRPRLSYSHGLFPAASGPGYRWDIRVRNQGQSPAKLTQVTVLLDGTVIAPAALEPGGNYWARIIGLLGVTPERDLAGWIVMPPEILGVGSEQPFVSATLLGAVPAILAVTTRIELRVAYESTFGETWTESSKTGEM